MTSTLEQSTYSLKAKLYPVDNLQYLLLDGPDMISQSLRSGKPWETSTLHILELFLSKIDKPVFIDIGANLGAISIPIGKYIKTKQGKVISFEPQRGVFYQLCGNIFANQLTDVCTAYNLAIGNKSTNIQIPVLDLANEHNIGALSIDENIRNQQNILSSTIKTFETTSLKPLDEIDLPFASIIKIDVEGLELEVLQGAQQYILNSNYPPLFFEVWGDYMQEYIPKKTELLNFVSKNLGYDTSFLGELCIAQHPSNKYFNIEKAENNSIRLKYLK